MNVAKLQNGSQNKTKFCNSTQNRTGVYNDDGGDPIEANRWNKIWAPTLTKNGDTRF